jgi:Rrf2 family iron-sulfur cluster assembly transcriptional regulator
MILTTKARYAVLAIIDIALENKNSPVSLFSVSERQNISLSYLEQIFIKLKNGGLVASIKGPGGGYVLTKKPNKITIADIINSIGESIKMTNCSTKNGCEAKKKRIKCKTHKLWKGLEHSIQGYLESLSLADICKNS